MRKIHMGHLAAFPGAPGVVVSPNDNGNTANSSSFTFTTQNATAQRGTATSYSWSISSSSGGSFSFTGGTTSSSATVQVTGVAAGATCSATVRCDVVVNGISVFDTATIGFQNTTPAYSPAVYPVGNFIGYNGANSASLLTMVWPSSHQVDDVMYLVVYTSNQAIATPTGFTSIYSGTGSGTAATADSIRASCFYRRATSGSEANVTIADSGDLTGYINMVLRGVDTTGNGLDTFASSLQTTATTSFSMAGVTTGVNNAFVLSMYGLGDDSAVISPTANSSLADPGFGYTKGGAFQPYTNGVDSSMAIYYGVDTTAGSVSATSWGTLTTTTRYEGVTLSVKPKSPAPTASFPSFSGITCADSTIGTATAIFQLKIDGIYIGSASPETYCTWAGVLPDYEVRVTATGSGGSFSGTLNTYLPLTSAQSWQLSNSSGADDIVTRTLSVTIRHATTLTVVVNAATVTLSAESLSDPIGGGIAGIVGVFL